MLSFLQKPFLGSTQVLYNPEYEGTAIYGIPRLEWRHPLVPGVRSNPSVALCRVMPHLQPEGTLATFIFEVTDLKMNDAAIEPVCGARFCDGRHRQEVSMSLLNDWT